MLSPLRSATRLLVLPVSLSSDCELPGTETISVIPTRNQDNIIVMLLLANHYAFLIRIVQSIGSPVVTSKSLVKTGVKILLGI